MATIKDALDIIGKLTTKDREKLRTMLKCQKCIS
jgi:hypothetical protein